MEALFTAFGEVFSDGEPVLKATALGRAHRRALYVIARKPGITVADLLARLKITKQSLARVVNDLLAGGYIARKQAAGDRRMRELELTEAGRALDARLWEAQRPRLMRAFREAGPAEVAAFRRVLDLLTQHPSAARGRP